MTRSSDKSLPETAMVLAAGMGKRMQPFTNTRPKPLVPVRGKALIDWTLDRLFTGGVKQIVVNTHYKADMLAEHLSARDDAAALTIIHEPDLLETGGGVLNALPHLGDAPFLVANSDSILLDGYSQHLTELAACWNTDDMDALLLLVPSIAGLGYDGAGDFTMRPDGRLIRRKRPLPAPFVFTGTQILKPELFRDMAVEPFSLNRIYDATLSRQRLFGVRHQGDWLHIGTPEGLSLAEHHLQEPFRHGTSTQHTLSLFAG